MQDFIDLHGLSGATYRFRSWPEGASHLPIAGNYVCVRVANRSLEVVLAGTSTDLSRCRTEIGKEPDLEATHIFTRLNVARATRSVEHEDITAKYLPVVSLSQDNRADGPPIGA